MFGYEPEMTAPSVSSGNCSTITLLRLPCRPYRRWSAPAAAIAGSQAAQFESEMPPAMQSEPSVASATCAL